MLTMFAPSSSNILGRILIERDYHLMWIYLNTFIEIDATPWQYNNIHYRKENLKQGKKCWLNLGIVAFIWTDLMDVIRIMYSWFFTFNNSSILILLEHVNVGILARFLISVSYNSPSSLRNMNINWIHDMLNFWKVWDFFSRLIRLLLDW